MEKREFMCRDQYGRLSTPLYNDGLCQFEHLIYYDNGNLLAPPETWRMDLDQIDVYYRYIGDNMENDLSRSFVYVVKSGCQNEEFQTNPNSCLINSESRYYGTNEPLKIETLYRMQCCCQDGSKCTKVQTHPKELICPYDKRIFVVNDNLITQLENNFTVFKSVDEVKLSRLCCRTFLERFYHNKDLKGFNPLLLVTSNVNAMLFKDLTKVGNSARNEISEELKRGLHHCAYYVNTEKKLCQFYFDTNSGKSLMIEKGNFVYLANIDFPRIKFELRDEDNVCFSAGGCETNIIGYECTTAKVTFLICWCKINETFYADYKLHMKLKQSLDSVKIYEPYCQVKSIHQNVTVQWSHDKFFCYESFTPHIGSFNITRMDFYNETADNAQFLLKDCLDAEKQCKVDENGMFICCCKAVFSPRNSSPKYFCNNGTLLQGFMERYKLQNPRNLVSSINERHSCDDTLKATRSVWDLDLSFHSIPLCYFSVKFSGKSALSDIKSVFYDSRNIGQGDNIGVFSMLCQVGKWTPQENARGCACRFFEPAVLKLRRSKIKSELSCCCVARYMNDYKQIALNMIKNRVIPYKMQEISNKP
ncbi:hypothetical protein DdX_14987 [Ditylenchus destructor]|uniref:Uncharacterized protein n=1 Tax=Ditylenchus destructor TaxID=166010 RepID=A0AAD4MVS9_9BILA|nr:hypothetical protein DdX_14987 [Ditylenchus destructor]